MTRSRVYVIVAMTTQTEKQKKDTKEHEKKGMTRIEENEKEKKRIESHEERTKIS